MTNDPVQMLRWLGTGVTPAGKARASAPLEGASFQSLLEQVRAGEVRTGAPVRVLESAGVTLSAEQLDRLSLAADRAEAEGATRALVVIDGMMLAMDVGVRTITGQVRADAQAVHAGFDAVVTVAPTTAPIAGAPGAAWGLLGVSAPMLDLLGKREAAGDRAA